MDKNTQDNNPKTITLYVKNWGKYNPKRDIKNPTWFCMHNDLFWDPFYYEITAMEKLVWVYILCQTSKQDRKKSDSINDGKKWKEMERDGQNLERIGKNWKEMERGGCKVVGRVVIIVHEAVTLIGINVEELLKSIEKLVKKRLVTKSVYRARQKKCRDATNFCQKNVGTRQKKVPYITEHNITEHNITKAPIGYSTEFIELYFLYPRKEGKSGGYKIYLGELKKDPDVFSKLVKAIEIYKKQLTAEKTEPRYILKFNNFMKNWCDYFDKYEASQKVDRMEWDYAPISDV